MPPIALAVPGSLDTRTGGTIFDRRIVHGLRQYGWPVSVLALDASFPFPTPTALAQADRALAGIETGTITLIDSLALGAIPDLVEREAARLPIVALVHLPLAADVGFDRYVAAGFEEGERRALHASMLVVVTGTAAVPLLERYALPRKKVVVVEPGTDRAPLASGSSGDRLELLSVAAITAGKGHELLLEALAGVPHRTWHLTCAGSLSRDPATADRVRGTVKRLGLEDQVTLAGDLDAIALETCYAAADVFVLATRQETYGMAVAEAIAHGIPVVATHTGAIPTLVGEEAGIVVPVGDREALEEALARVIADAAHRMQLAEGARRVRGQLPSWEATCARMAQLLGGQAVHG